MPLSINPTTPCHAAYLAARDEHLAVKGDVKAEHARSMAQNVRDLEVLLHVDDDHTIADVGCRSHVYTILRVLDTPQLALGSVAACSA